MIFKSKYQRVLKDEYKSLRNKLNLAEKANKGLADDLKVSQKEVTNLKEELKLAKEEKSAVEKEYADFKKDKWLIKKVPSGRMPNKQRIGAKSGAKTSKIIKDLKEKL